MLTDDMNCRAMTAGAFTVVAGVAALQFFSDVPKVRTDIVEVRELVWSLTRRPLDVEVPGSG